MKYYGEAEKVANSVIEAFSHPETLPAPMAHIVINRKSNYPSRYWSLLNQFIMFSKGHTDARGFGQWKAVRRGIKAGEKAFYIFAPVKKTAEDEETGEKRTVLYGFRGQPVFGYDQTAGEPLPPPSSFDEWFASLPLLDVASHWGITVKAVKLESALGFYTGEEIGLAVENLATWAHEMVHAADLRLLRKAAQEATDEGKVAAPMSEDDEIARLIEGHVDLEVVAEFGSAVLLHLLGKPVDADLGGAWEYIQGYASVRNMPVIQACDKVLKRTCECVASILDTAEELKKGSEPPLSLAV